MSQEKRIKVLIAKPGLDGHDAGAKMLAFALRDAGMEVIYTGIRQTPEAIAQAAVQEAVDVVGLSCLSASHNTLFPKVVRLLREHGMGDTLVIGGGVIPEEDISYLQQQGVKAIFGPGTPFNTIVSYIHENTKTAS